MELKMLNIKDLEKLNYEVNILRALLEFTPSNTKYVTFGKEIKNIGNRLVDGEKKNDG